MGFRLFPSRLRAGVQRRVPRTLAVALFGFQAFLWGGGSIVEAQAAAESLTRYSHVEDQSTTACPPIHSHLDCLICRTLNGGSTSTAAMAIVASESPGAAKFRVNDVMPRDRGLHGTLGSRGPPSA